MPVPNAERVSGTTAKVYVQIRRYINEYCKSPNSFSLKKEHLHFQQHTVDAASGTISYPTRGEQSVSPEQLIANCCELFQLMQTPEYVGKSFAVAYRDHAVNRNGYSPEQIALVLVSAWRIWNAESNGMQPLPRTFTFEEGFSWLVSKFEKLPLIELQEEFNQSFFPADTASNETNEQHGNTNSEISSPPTPSSSHPVNSPIVNRVVVQETECKSHFKIIVDQSGVSPPGIESLRKVKIGSTVDSLFLGSTKIEIPKYVNRNNVIDQVSMRAKCSEKKGKLTITVPLKNCFSGGDSSPRQFRPTGSSYRYISGPRQQYQIPTASGILYTTITPEEYERISKAPTASVSGTWYATPPLASEIASLNREKKILIGVEAENCRTPFSGIRKKISFKFLSVAVILNYGESVIIRNDTTHVFPLTAKDAQDQILKRWSNAAFHRRESVGHFELFFPGESWEKASNQEKARLRHHLISIALHVLVDTGCHVLETISESLLAISTLQRVMQAIHPLSAAFEIDSGGRLSSVKLGAEGSGSGEFVTLYCLLYMPIRLTAGRVLLLEVPALAVSWLPARDQFVIGNNLIQLLQLTQLRHEICGAFDLSFPKGELELQPKLQPKEFHGEVVGVLTLGELDNFEPDLIKQKSGDLIRLSSCQELEEFVLKRQSKIVHRLQGRYQAGVKIENGNVGDSYPVDLLD